MGEKRSKTPEGVEKKTVQSGQAQLLPVEKNESTGGRTGGELPGAGEERTLFHRVKELEQQLSKAQAELEEVRARETARKERARPRERAKKQRYRERHREQDREYSKLYMRRWRAAQRRQQDSDPRSNEK